MIDTEALHDAAKGGLALAAEGLFNGAPSLLFNIWGVEMGLEGERHYASLINPPEVAQRFEAELGIG